MNATSPSELKQKTFKLQLESAASRVNKPRLFAIVVSWNLHDQVLNCIRTLLDQPCIEQIILVDNGSWDDTPAAVKEIFPNIKVIELDTNKGFAAAANLGISRAMQLGAEYVVLVNSDTEIPLGAAEQLLSAAIEENAAATGAKLIRRESPGVLDGAWGVINWRNFVSRVEGEGKPDGPNYSKRKRVDYPLGGFLMLETKALESVGLFDESYFAYHEELELSERLRRAGYTVVFEPVGIPHGVRGSVRCAGAELAREYLLARNSFRFVRSYGGPWDKLKFWIIVFTASVVKFPVVILKGKSKEHLANIAGWWHGILNRPFDEKLKARYRLI